MKIYDKKMFRERLGMLFGIIPIWIFISNFFDYHRISYWSGLLPAFVVAFRLIAISMSEQKLKDYKLEEQLNTVARENLFGKKDRYLKWGWVVLLISALPALKYSVTASVVLFATGFIYIIWYFNAIGKEIERLKKDMIEFI
ncbi:MAG: hypothetical protein II977_09070 [Oscillospiraceae bacterium]|nr:hypothetical protein [Oscillospiraceae bacterium]